MCRLFCSPLDWRPPLTAACLIWLEIRISNAIPLMVFTQHWKLIPRSSDASQLNRWRLIAPRGAPASLPWNLRYGRSDQGQAAPTDGPLQPARHRDSWRTRTHLKNVDVEFPATGSSCSRGCRAPAISLAFDTIYAEGQRRYVESLSAYARQFLEMMQKPDVDQIDGLSPAISIEQKTTLKNARSTVGTFTESTTTCACCGRASACPPRPRRACRSRARPSRRWSIASSHCPKVRGSICWRRSCEAARASTEKGARRCLKKGFQHIKINGVFHELANAPVARQEIPARSRRRGRSYRGAAGYGRAPRGKFGELRSSSQRDWRWMDYAEAAPLPNPPRKGEGAD